jgi:hypothetical protein
MAIIPLIYLCQRQHFHKKCKIYSFEISMADESFLQYYPRVFDCYISSIKLY